MIEFDSELDCGRMDVFQPAVITVYEECVLITQWDGAGEDRHCVGIPTKNLDAFIGALTVANKNRKRALVLDCERKQVYFEDEKDEA
jgi:hypothetical protein